MSTKVDPATGIEHVYRENRLSLIRLGFLLTGSRHEAEDLVQTAFAAAQHRWCEIEQPIAYLRQVIVNRAKDGQRRAFRAPPPPPLEAITHIAEIDETFAAILELSETQRAVVVLHFYDDATLIEHLRRTLHSVAETVADDGQASTLVVAIPFVERSRRKPAKKNIAIAAAMAVAGLGLVAWNTFDDGEIKRIPTEAALMQGSTDGFDWWLIPSEAIGHTNPCDVPFPGVEMVSSSTNEPGQEWNTGGVNYGKNLLDDQVPAGGSTFTYDCSNPQSEFDEAAWFGDPTLMSVGFTRLGRNDDLNSPWGAFAAMHPTIAHINVIVDGETIATIDTITKTNEPGGVRYAGFTIPSDVCTFRLDYLEADAQTPVVSKESTIC